MDTHGLTAWFDICNMQLMCRCGSGFWMSSALAMSISWPWPWPWSQVRGLAFSVSPWPWPWMPWPWMQWPWPWTQSLKTSLQQASTAASDVTYDWRDSRQMADAAVWRADVMAAILKAWGHVKNPVIHAYLLEEQSCQISPWSNVKLRRLKLFLE